MEILKPIINQTSLPEAFFAEITPDKAKEILGRTNTRNRPVNKVTVSNYAHQMQSGLWTLNGDAIRFSEDGVLLDGQHRLSAVVLSGIPITSLVVGRLPKDVFPTIDGGKVRTGGDTLCVQGEKNYCRLSSALQMVDKYFTGRADKSVTYSNSEITVLLQKYPGVRNSIQTKLKTSLVPPSILDACHFLFSLRDPDLANVFVDKILRGVDLKEGDPIYLLRERLMFNSMAKAKLSRAYIFALCIKAWNAARSGKSIRTLRWREKGDAVESFPVVQ